MKTRAPRRQISSERRLVHAFGLGLVVIGIIIVVVCFIQFASAGSRSAHGGGGAEDPMWWWIGGVVGMLMTAVGSALRRGAARGIAGSGLVLDPQRAREDLEPWARAGGGLLRDALDEAGVRSPHEAGGTARDDDPIVKVRCRECGALNDEDARFCDACGGKL